MMSANHLSLIANCIKVLTKKDFKKTIPKKTIIGEMSIPNLNPIGRILLIGSSIGSVVLYKNWIIGLKGSGFTQLINARMSINQ